MPYKSIQGPLVLSLALIALVAGMSGAPQSDPSQSHQSQSVSDSNSASRGSRPQAASADRGRAHESAHRGGQDIKRQPLAAADVVTNSVDGAASTIALRGSNGGGAKLSYSLAMAPRHGRVTIENGRATYRPDPGFAGVDTYTYRVHSGEHSAEAMVAVTSIRDRNLPATAAAAL